MSGTVGPSEPSGRRWRASRPSSLCPACQTFRGVTDCTCPTTGRQDQGHSALEEKHRPTQGLVNFRVLSAEVSLGLFSCYLHKSKSAKAPLLVILGPIIKEYKSKPHFLPALLVTL